MNWEAPDFVEIKMDAEISAYQEDSFEPIRPYGKDPLRPLPPKDNGASDAG